MISNVMFLWKGLEFQELKSEVGMEGHIFIHLSLLYLFICVLLSIYLLLLWVPF